MKKMVFVLVLIIIIVSMCMSVYAFVGYPATTADKPYIVVIARIDTEYQGNYYLDVYITDKPLVIMTGPDFNGVISHWLCANESTSALVYYYNTRSSIIPEPTNMTITSDTKIWLDSPAAGYATNPKFVYDGNYIIGDFYGNSNIVNMNVTNNGFYNAYKGISFDYEGFLGKLGIKLFVNKDSIGKIKSAGGGGASGGAGSSGSYGGPIQEWHYEEPSGTVNISDDDIVYYNNAEYKVEIYNGDEIVNTYYYYVVVDEKLPYVNISYPSNGMKYEYYPNINIEYYDMGKLYIYINGEMYKQIYTKNKEGIEVIDGKNELFDIGSNTVAVKDSNGQVVATVQYTVMREGSDPNIEYTEFEAESWVQGLFNRIMNEYSLFFTYVKGIYSFLPVEIVGLVVIIMMLSVILWFTGRK